MVGVALAGKPGRIGAEAESRGGRAVSGAMGSTGLCEPRGRGLRAGLDTGFRTAVSLLSRSFLVTCSVGFLPSCHTHCLK